MDSSFAEARNGITEALEVRSRMAFTASVASSRLPCVGTDEISPADRVADHQGRGSLEIDDDEGGLEGGPVDLIQDRIFRHVSDDGQTRPT